MKLQILQEDLSRALINASRFTSAHAQLPVLGNIMLATKKTKLQVSATNLEISILVSVGAKIEEEDAKRVPSETIGDKTLLFEIFNIINIRAFFFSLVKRPIVFSLRCLKTLIPKAYRQTEQ